MARRESLHPVGHARLRPVRMGAADDSISKRMVEDLEAVIDAAGVEQCDLLGI